MLIKIPFDLFIQKLTQMPAADNYVDTLFNSDPKYLSEYQFFADDHNNLFGLSPENNLHIYASDEKVIQDFIQDKNPHLIFSLYEKNYLFSSRNVKAFYYLNKTAEPSNKESLILADSTHQEFVNHWYEEFNKEEGSSWKAPDLSLPDSGRLFLLKHDDQIIGGASNTLFSSSRFWVGRLWIDPRYRSLGNGEKMMRALENIAFNENKKISLLVTQTNQKALALYKKLNYAEISLNAYWY